MPPLLKRTWLEYAVDQLQSALAAQHVVDLPLLERFVGRLTNLSQFFPELRHALEVGYALVNVRWQFAPGTAHRRADKLALAAGGRREEQLLALCDVTLAVARDDVGVSMAPAAIFADVTDAGVLTVITDASHAAADDGLGGFAFLSTRPGTVFVMSDPWPADVKRALSQAATRRADRDASPAEPALSMPAAEVTAALALATAVAAACEVRAAIAIGDCDPAASALTSLSSRSAQIHYLVGQAQRVIPRWLGVHVPRRWNTDADRLSHPSLAREVIADAEASGLFVQRVHMPVETAQAAGAATRLPLRYIDRTWQQ